MPNDPSTQPEGPSRPGRRRFSEREKLRILDSAAMLMVFRYMTDVVPGFQPCSAAFVRPGAR